MISIFTFIWKRYKVMEKLTFKEFLKLSEEEKCKRYIELSDHDKFLARIGQNSGAVLTGRKVEITEEERMKWVKEVDEELEKYRREKLNK